MDSQKSVTNAISIAILTTEVGPLTLRGCNEAREAQLLAELEQARQLTPQKNQRRDDSLSRLETKWQQDAGTMTSHRMVPVGAVRQHTHFASCGREALVSVASKG